MDHESPMKLRPRKAINYDETDRRDTCTCGRCLDCVSRRHRAEAAAKNARIKNCPNNPDGHITAEELTLKVNRPDLYAIAYSEHDWRVKQVLEGPFYVDCEQCQGVFIYYKAKWADWSENCGLGVGVTMTQDCTLTYEDLQNFWAQRGIEERTEHEAREQAYRDNAKKGVAIMEATVRENIMLADANIELEQAMDNPALLIKRLEHLANDEEDEQRVGEGEENMEGLVLPQKHKHKRAGLKFKEWLTNSGQGSSISGCSSSNSARGEGAGPVMRGPKKWFHRKREAQKAKKAARKAIEEGGEAGGSGQANTEVEESGGGIHEEAGLVLEEMCTSVALGGEAGGSGGGNTETGGSSAPEVAREGEADGSHINQGNGMEVEEEE